MNGQEPDSLDVCHGGKKASLLRAFLEELPQKNRVQCLAARGLNARRKTPTLLWLGCSGGQVAEDSQEIADFLIFFLSSLIRVLFSNARCLHFLLISSDRSKIVVGTTIIPCSVRRPEGPLAQCQKLLTREQDSHQGIYIPGSSKTLRFRYYPDFDSEIGLFTELRTFLYFTSFYAFHMFWCFLRDVKETMLLNPNPAIHPHPKPKQPMLP